MRDAFIVAAVRTPIGKAFKGALREVRPEDLAAAVLRELLRRVPGQEPAGIDDVILGCAIPEGEQGLNVARMASLRAGLPVSVPAVTVNRLCASGLQAIAFAVDRIRSGQADAILAGGVESMSLVPMPGARFMASPVLVDSFPGVYMGVGLTAERVAARCGIGREAQDRFALSSHLKALAAIQAGRFAEETFALSVEQAVRTAQGTVERRELCFERDEGPRADTTLEKLAALKPAFAKGGTVTAGNTSQMSDGAAGVLVLSGERMEALGLAPMGRLASYGVGGVEPELMGLGPLAAVPRALDRAGWRVPELELVELNEAFAAQVLPVVRDLGLDEATVNVNGGAIALGHPLGCTGARLVVSLLHEARRRGLRRCLATLCVGGGMGAAATFECC